MKPSVATRTPRPKKRGSRVGFIVDPFRRIRIWYESALEEAILLCLVASPAVTKVEEQQRIRYRDADGADWTYTSDFRVTWRSGRVSTIEAKYVADAVKGRTTERLELIAANAIDGMTDDYRIVTERDVDEVSIANARDIVGCGLDDDVLGKRHVADVLKRLPSTTTLAEVVDASGLGVRGYRAAVALLQSGVLSLGPGVRIQPDSVVTRPEGDSA